MTAALSIAPVSPPAPPALSPFPSRRALALEQTSMAGLEREFLRGTTPVLAELAGWEFRGINHLPLNALPLAQAVGIKKFVKGFYRDGDRVMGYNKPVGRNVLDGRWHVTDKPFGYYEVHEVDATARDNVYLHAVLLDYGRGGGKLYDPTRGLRDYVVQLDDDLFLGKAYYALGPLRIPTNFFILERHRVGLTDFERR